jgi:hypothetical protein
LSIFRRWPVADFENADRMCFAGIVRHPVGLHDVVATQSSTTYECRCSLQGINSTGRTAL